MHKQILVTGGCGFIGSHLIDKLMTEGHSVICIDNCFSSTDTNIEKWLSNPKFNFIKHDIITPLQFDKIDQIYHLACPASPKYYQKDPIQTIKTSVLGTLNILELAKINKATILLSSTSEIYGDPEIHPQVEDYRGNVNPIGIRSCYDEGKRLAETLMFDYHRTYGVNIKIARIFNTYGPKMLENDGRVVSNFIVQAIKGIPITIYGDGSQTRSFCYIDNLVDGLIKLMDSTEIGPINLGNPEEYTILQLANIIKNMINPSIPILFKQLPSDDPTKRKPDISRAKNLLNWEPTINLEHGLKLTIAYFMEKLQ